jgi:hypothetical protein
VTLREDAKPTTPKAAPTKGPTGCYLCSWTGVLRAEAGGPGVSGMLVTATVRTAVSKFSRQVRLQLVVFVLQFTGSTSRKAEQNTTNSSSALKRKLGIRLLKFKCDAFPPVLLERLWVLYSGVGVRLLGSYIAEGAQLKRRGLGGEGGGQTCRSVVEKRGMHHAWAYGA